MKFSDWSFILANHRAEFEILKKGTKYWRNRLLKVASQLEEQNGKSPFKYQFAIGARKEFENTIFEELGGNDSWGEKGIGLFQTFYSPKCDRVSVMTRNDCERDRSRVFKMGIFVCNQS